MEMVVQPSRRIWKDGEVGITVSCIVAFSENKECSIIRSNPRLGSYDNGNISIADRMARSLRLLGCEVGVYAIEMQVCVVLRKTITEMRLMSTKSIFKC